MFTRRAVVAAAVAAMLPFRRAAAEIRGVYDLKGSAWTSVPSWMTCQQPTLSTAGGIATVEVVCRTNRGAKVPRRGVTISLEADVEYAETGEDVGRCETTARVKRPGSVTMSCQIALPQEPALPIEITGNGRGITEPFWIPGGSLIFDVSATPNPDDYGWISIDLAEGYGYTLWDTDEPATSSEVNFIDELTQGIITSRVDGPWRVVIRQAFP